MTTTNAGFPALKPIPHAVSDCGVHLGDSAFTAKLPSRRVKIVRVLAAVSLCALAACTPGQQASVPVTPANVCAAINAAKNNPTAAAQLNALDPHSALGVVWADAQSGCNGPMPVAGVNATWTTQVWTMAQSLIPVVLPLLIGLI